MRFAQPYQCGFHIVKQCGPGALWRSRARYEYIVEVGDPVNRQHGGRSGSEASFCAVAHHSASDLAGGGKADTYRAGNVRPSARGGQGRARLHHHARPRHVLAARHVKELRAHDQGAQLCRRATCGLNLTVLGASWSVCRSAGWRPAQRPISRLRAACGHVPDAGSKSCARPLSPCENGSHADACAQVWKVEMCVSRHALHQEGWARREPQNSSRVVYALTPAASR